MQYRICKIPKISGGKCVGTRFLEVPTSELKTLQRNILSELRKSITYPTYIGGMIGTSTVTNSIPHTNKCILYKIDLKNFFHTVTWDKLKDLIPIHLKEKIQANCLYNNRLPTGAPTSPMLATLAFTPVDIKILALLEAKNIAYTRYIDDISMSSDSLNTLNRDLIKSIFNTIIDSDFKINYKKSTMSLSWNRQIVTGIIVNNKLNYPKEKRLLLRAKLDHVARNKEKLSPELLGELSYLKSINKNSYNKFINYFNKRTDYYNA